MCARSGASWTVALALVWAWVGKASARLPARTERMREETILCMDSCCEVNAAKLTLHS